MLITFNNKNMISNILQFKNLLISCFIYIYFNAATNYGELKID